jgi:tetratricopeptide (TPR) repeat protein
LRYNYGIGYSLGLKGWYLIWEGKFNEALECFEEAYIVYERDKNRGGIARTIARKGVSYLYLGNNDLALRFLKEALSICEGLDIKRLNATIHFFLAIAYDMNGNIELASKHDEITCDLFREIGDKTILALALYNSASRKINNDLEYEIGVAQINEAISYAKEAGSIRTINTIQTGLSYAYLYRGEIRKALEFIYDLIEYFEDREDYEALALAKAQIGYINLKKGDLDEAHKNYLECIEYNKKRIKLADVRYPYIQIGQIYQTKGDYNKALHYYTEAIKISINLENKLSLAMDYSLLISYYIEIEDMHTATHYLELLREINQEREHIVIEIVTKMSTALVLKKSENEQERKQAKELFISIIKAEDIDYDYIELAILNLCEVSC